MSITSTCDEKNLIIKRIQKMSGKYGVYEIFGDWVKLMALAFANQCDPYQGQIWERRENEYIETLNRYSKKEQTEIFEMTAWLIEWAEKEFCDMLGFIYMHLELGSSRTGQFFTPYHVCRLLAESSGLTVKKGNIINEPSCGAGGNIIALAEYLKNKGFDYQKYIRVICQDIDIKAVYMAYVQLNLYGVPAMVYQTDTLKDPSGKESSTGKLFTYGWITSDLFWRY